MLGSMQSDKNFVCPRHSLMPQLVERADADEYNQSLWLDLVRLELIPDRPSQMHAAPRLTHQDHFREVPMPRVLQISRSLPKRETMESAPVLEAQREQSMVPRRQTGLRPARSRAQKSSIRCGHHDIPARHL